MMYNHSPTTYVRGYKSFILLHLQDSFREECDNRK